MSKETHRRLSAVRMHEALQFSTLLGMGAVHRGHTLVCRSEDNLSKPVLSFHRVGSRGQAWSIRHDHKHLYPLSRLSGPGFKVFFSHFFIKVEILL